MHSGFFEEFSDTSNVINSKFILNVLSLSKKSLKASPVKERKEPNGLLIDKVSLKVEYVSLGDMGVKSSLANKLVEFVVNNSLKF